MKRFIRYLYEYENEKRIRNVGFIKVETGYEESIVQLQAKGFHDTKERQLVLYLFYVENDTLIVFPQGERRITSPVLSWHLVFSASDVGGQENYSKICGVLVESGSGRSMAATWDDCCVNVSQVENYAEHVALEEMDLRPDMEEAICEETVCEEAVCEEAVCEEAENGTKYTKISRQDISKLPRCEWSLANNQFLVHGYNNFHHLLLIDDGNYLKLGVPGIYHIKEAKCAEMFGFGEFIQASELVLDSDEEENPEEMFGYWCRRVRRRR